MIKAENVDVGFEFSAAAKKPPGMMDSGRVSLSINTIGLGTGNVDKFNIKYRFSEEEIDNTAPPASHAGVLEKCVIKIAFLYVQQVKALL